MSIVVVAKKFYIVSLLFEVGGFQFSGGKTFSRVKLSKGTTMAVLDGDAPKGCR